MAKAVLISIRPEWVARISSGVKTIEVRKKCPRLKPPFRCYVYCTLPNTHNPHKMLEIHGTDGKIRRANGKVIGEFICDKITTLTHIGTSRTDMRLVSYESDGVAQKVDFASIQMGLAELERYLNGGYGFAWHISSLYIYNQPKELREFRKPCKDNLFCESSAMYRTYDDSCRNAALQFSRPPQSWCYVEEL